MTHNTGARNLILEKFSALGAPLSNSPPLYLLYSLYLNPSLAPLPKIPILQETRPRQGHVLNGPRKKGKQL